MNEIIEKRLQKYQVKNINEEINVLKEIVQEVILYALSQTEFFSKSTFCGGTCLRIIYGLERFSEDLDFSTIRPDDNFHFDHYLPEVLKILKSFGLEMNVSRQKDDTFVKARELKEDSFKWKLSFPNNGRLKKIMIKLEIDTNPPLAGTHEYKTLDFPLLHKVQIADKETLFSGKIHALLCRGFIKGRDWYDFLWYIKNQYRLNTAHLQMALKQIGPYKGQDITVDKNFIVSQLQQKILTNNWTSVAQDVERFLRPIEVSTLKLWNKELFLDRLQKINI